MDNRVAFSEFGPLPDGGHQLRLVKILRQYLILVQGIERTELQQSFAIGEEAIERANCRNTAWQIGE